MPTLPVPKKLRLELVLPLKEPPPEMLLVMPAVPKVSVLPLRSIMSFTPLKVIQFPPAGAVMFRSIPFNNRVVLAEGSLIIK